MVISLSFVKEQLSQCKFFSVVSFYSNEVVYFNVNWNQLQESQGGGLALVVDKDIKSNFIRVGNGEVEVMPIQVCLDDIPVRTLIVHPSLI